MKRGDVDTIQNDSTTTGSHESTSHIDQGRLTGPVRTDQTHNLAGLDSETYVGQRLDGTKGDGDALQFECFRFRIPRYRKSPLRV